MGTSMCYCAFPRVIFSNVLVDAKEKTQENKKKGGGKNSESRDLLVTRRVRVLWWEKSWRTSALGPLPPPTVHLGLLTPQDLGHEGLKILQF